MCLFFQVFLTNIEHLRAGGAVQAEPQGYGVIAKCIVQEIVIVIDIDVVISPVQVDALSVDAWNKRSTTHDASGDIALRVIGVAVEFPVGMEAATTDLKIYQILSVSKQTCRKHTAVRILGTFLGHSELPLRWLGTQAASTCHLLSSSLGLWPN